MLRIRGLTGLVAFAIVSPGVALAAMQPSAADRTFVATVSEGGLFEVSASRLATTKAAAADVRDFAVAEVHDHGLVGDKLKTISARLSVTMVPRLGAEFQARLDRLKARSGRAFDVTYMSEMAQVHGKDGAAFAAEASGGSAPELKAFAAETHVIVLRHLGAIHAAPPPAG